MEALVLADAEPRLAYFDLSGVLTLATGDGKVRRRIALGRVPAVAMQLGERIVVGTGGELRSYEIADLWKSGSAGADRPSSRALD